MKRPNRKDYINTKTKNELIADLEKYINCLEHRLLTIAQQPLSVSQDSPKSCPTCGGKGEILGFPKNGLCPICNVTVSPNSATKKCYHIQPIQDYAKQLGHISCPVCGGNFT